MATEVEEINTIQPLECSLRILAEEREKEIRVLLSKPPLRLRWKTDIPELRKQLLIILTRLSELRRLLYQRQETIPLTAVEIEKYSSIVNIKVDSYAANLDSATDYADSLERILVDLGGSDYLHTLLLYESHYDNLNGEGIALESIL